MHVRRRVDGALFRQRHVRLRLGLFALDVRGGVRLGQLSGLLLHLLLLLLVFLHPLEDLIFVAQP
jgi:hypothetical protein